MSGIYPPPAESESGASERQQEALDTWVGLLKEGGSNISATDNVVAVRFSKVSGRVWYRDGGVRSAQPRFDWPRCSKRLSRKGEVCTLTSFFFRFSASLQLCLHSRLLPSISLCSILTTTHKPTRPPLGGPTYTFHPLKLNSRQNVWNCAWSSIQGLARTRPASFGILPDEVVAPLKTFIREIVNVGFAAGYLAKGAKQYPGGEIMGDADEVAHHAWTRIVEMSLARRAQGGGHKMSLWVDVEMGRPIEVEVS